MRNKKRNALDNLGVYFKYYGYTLPALPYYWMTYIYIMYIVVRISIYRRCPIRIIEREVLMLLREANK